MPASALALMASLLWGVADFLGGTASRRLHAYAVIGASQGIALVGLVVYAVATGAFHDPRDYVPWALAAGAVGLVALGAFYVALAAGTMGVVAPIAATGVVVPVAIGLGSGESPSAWQLVGAGVTVLGVVLASGPEIRSRGESSGGLRPILLAFVAAVGFGGVLWLVAEGSESSVPMTLVVMRVLTVTVLAGAALTLRTAGGIRPGDLPLLAVIGAFDAGANATYGLATQDGLVSLSSVLASLYPAVTVLLARQLHGERMRRSQDAGVVLTLAGVAVMAATGGAG